MARLKALFLVWVFLACVLAAEAPRYGGWSSPVNLDVYNKWLDPEAAAVNWPGKTDQTACVSRDGLSLYFSSGRAVGSMDLYVAQRASTDEAWGTPIRLGENLNFPTAMEQTPVLSPDGHRLYFASNRPGGVGGLDIYVSRRQDERDDFGWGPAESLGPTINTTLNDNPGSFFEDEATGTTVLYFSRVDAVAGISDIFAATLLPDGSLLSPVTVDSLNTEFADQFPTVRRDGLEVVFASDRPGSVGGLDLWVAVRTTTFEPWSEPELLEGFNSPYTENHPHLSFDGTTLYFTSTRPLVPPLPGAQQELWVAVRHQAKGRPQ